MNWEYYWNNTAEAKDDLTQVGRINANQEIAIEQAGQRLVDLLDIKVGDSVLDVCCGNGLITDFIARKGITITGVDLSEKLILNAKQKNHHITFIKQDAMNLHLNQQFDKIYLAFSFQYFDSFDKGKAVIGSMLKHAKPGATLLLTDVPDSAKWSHFYNSLLKKLFYFKQKLTGKLVMGKFWSAQEMKEICEGFQVKGEWLQQPPTMPYSHYRFDYRITKP